MGGQPPCLYFQTFTTGSHPGWNRIEILVFLKASPSGHKKTHMVGYISTISPFMGVTIYHSFQFYSIICPLYVFSYYWHSHFGVNSHYPETCPDDHCALHFPANFCGSDFIIPWVSMVITYMRLYPQTHRDNHIPFRPISHVQSCWWYVPKNITMIPSRKLT